MVIVWAISFNDDNNNFTVIGLVQGNLSITVRRAHEIYNKIQKHK